MEAPPRWSPRGGSPLDRAQVRIRSLLRRARAELSEWSGANARALQRLDGSRAAVLMYHRVLPRELAKAWAVEPGMFVTPETFRRHLDWFEESYRVLPLAEIVDRLAEGKRLPERAVAITFDDGWRDNYEYALPGLIRRKLPATVFVVTDRVGTSGAFWPDEVCRRLGSVSPAERSRLARALGASDSQNPLEDLLAHLKQVPETERPGLLAKLRAATPKPADSERELLDWDELDELARAGIDVESHGATHAILTLSADDVVRKELSSARDRLWEHGHGRHALLTYPSGAYDDRVMRMAREVDYRAAFTLDPGLLGAEQDPMALPRLGLHEDVSRSRTEFLARMALTSEAAQGARSPGLAGGSKGAAGLIGPM